MTEPHVCLDRDGNPRTNNDGQPLTPARVYCGACDGQWCERCDPAPSALCPFCDHGSSTATLKLPANQRTDEKGRPERVDLACPQCGGTGLETLERIIGSCGLSAWVKPDGSREMEFGGETEMWWDSSVSTHIECHDCDWSVALDQGPDAPTHEEQIVALLVVAK